MMKRGLNNLIQQIDALALKAVMLDAGDIPGFGETLKAVELIEGLSRKINEKSLIRLTEAMKGYIEKLIMGERSELPPLEAAISQLQEICRKLNDGGSFDKNIATLLTALDSEEADPADIASGPGDQAQMQAGDHRPKTTAADLEDKTGAQTQGAPGVIDDEDKEIITDFISESLENLGSIEINVMDLEQDPTDLETINAIFRPFHTVKGVSGFLNFNKINKLAHAVENLLDKARNRELTIDEEIIDLTLDSVDLLKQMIENVQSSLDTGIPSEGDLDIRSQVARIEHFANPGDGHEQKRLGQILVSKEVLSEGELADALHIQEEAQNRKIGEILVEEKKAGINEVVSALRDQKKSSRPVRLQVKIDTGKLDNVVDMVGELAIAQSMLRQNELIKENQSRKLDHIINQLNQITSGLQKTAMSLRMVPIKHTFQKMLRLVRDLAKKGGKEVGLVMSGEDTEIDRNMVEEIYEPMVHIMRNSVDHGIELAEEREAATKPGRGTIKLSAYHKGGEIIIEIKDDGRGLNKEKIRQKALARGLIEEEDTLTEGEINNLIFHPGFSTADQITDISGRGVGMDVVKTRIIERLRGRVEVQSVEGQGTTILLRLPLTLAILDGMVVELNQQKYILPTLTVQEFFRPKREAYSTVKGKGEMIRVRNHLAPLIRLDRLLKLNGNKPSDANEKAPWKKLVAVVENQERTGCLLIDELLGQEEVVIKGLGDKFKDIKGIAGGAIMGDGKISLILDIAGIFDLTS